MAPTAPPAEVPGGLFSALRHRNYALFWSGALVSNTGTWLGNLTVPYVLYQSTGSAIWVGIATAAQFGPALLLSPVGGLLADGVDRRILLAWTQAGLGLVATLMWLQWASGLHEPWLLIALLTLFGMLNGINNPAWQSLVNDLVPRGDILSAVTLNSLQFNLARAIGPAIAGVLLSGLGATWAFFLNAASFVVVVVTLLFVRTARKVPARTAGSGFRAQWAEALGYLRAHRVLLLAVLLCCLVGFAANPIFSLTVVFAESVYGTSARGLGLLTAALGAGAVLFALAGLLPARRPASFGRKLVASFLVLGLGHAAYALLNDFSVGLLAGVAIGAAFLGAMSTLNSIIQLTAPDRLRGRIMAVRHMVFSSSVALGSFLSGVMSDAWGVQSATLLLGVLLLALAAGLGCSRTLRGWLDGTQLADPEGIAR